MFDLLNIHGFVGTRCFATFLAGSLAMSVRTIVVGSVMGERSPKEMMVSPNTTILSPGNVLDVLGKSGVL